jgi:hypothetical protein
VTVEQLLADVRSAQAQRQALQGRLTGAGHAIKAQLMDDITETYRAEARAWNLVGAPLVGQLDGPVFDLLINAASAAQALANDYIDRWSEHAANARRRAERIEQKALQAFASGPITVPTPERAGLRLVPGELACDGGPDGA